MTKKNEIKLSAQESRDFFRTGSDIINLHKEVKPEISKNKVKNIEEDEIKLTLPYFGPTPEEIAALSEDDYKNYLRTGIYYVTPRGVGSLTTVLTYSANTFLNGNGEFTVPTDIIALTGVTNLGSGTTLGGTNLLNATLKSISAKGGVSLLGDRSNIIISGQTNVTPAWSSVTGKPQWLSGTTLNNFQLGHTHSQYVLLTGTTTINTQTGRIYTLAATDNKKLITFNNVTGITVTVPANSGVTINVGSQFDIAQVGAGVVAVAPANGSVTINSKSGYLKINGQYARVSLIKTATNTWLLSGDLKS